MTTDSAGNDPCRSARAVAVAPIEIRLTHDGRLLAALDTIVTQTAHRAGLAEDAQGLAAATIQVCEQIFHLGGDTLESPLHVSVAGLPDRVEIVVQSISSAGATFDEKKIRKALEVAPVDRFQIENFEGKPRITLVKNCGAAKSTK